MKPIRTEDCNSVLKLPGGTDENDLPCRVEDGWTHSTWEMTEQERARVLENELVVVWLWWPNLLGVSLTVGESERAHTDADMTMATQVDDGYRLFSLSARLDENELEQVRSGAPLKLAVAMHPTCPVALSTYESAEAA